MFSLHIGGSILLPDFIRRKQIISRFCQAFGKSIWSSCYIQSWVL